MRIGIVVDSCCDLPKDFIDEHKIVVMPITLRIGELLIEDRRDPAETQSFYTKHLDRKSEDFAESIPYSVQQIEKLFLERLVLDYDYVFCLTITSGRSAIYDHAMQASRTILTKYRDVRRAAGVPERFGLAVLSSRNMFAGQAVQAAEAVRLIRAGGTPSEIGARLRNLVDVTHTYMVPADLSTSTNGRRRRATRASAGVPTRWVRCSMWPILYCHQDQTGPVDKVRDSTRALSACLPRQRNVFAAALRCRMCASAMAGRLNTFPVSPGMQHSSARRTRPASISCCRR